MSCIFHLPWNSLTPSSSRIVTCGTPVRQRKIHIAQSIKTERFLFQVWNTSTLAHVVNFSTCVFRLQIDGLLISREIQAENSYINNQLQVLWQESCFAVPATWNLVLRALICAFFPPSSYRLMQHILILSNSIRCKVDSRLNVPDIRGIRFVRTHKS